MSWWNNTFLSAGTGLKFPFRLSFIRLYSTCRNWERSPQSCFVLRGDSVPACSWFRIRPLLPLQITAASQTPTHHCLITHCVFGGRVLLPTVDWAGQERPRTEHHSTPNHKSLMKMVFKQWSNGAEIKKPKKAEIFRRQSASNTFAPPSFILLSNCHRTFRKNQRNRSKQSSWHRLPLRISFPLNTDTRQHFMLKRQNVSAAILGLCKEI